jgi:hypothetical protein
MAFDARQWLGTARLLDPGGAASDEANVRTAWGRAYYSAFQCALERLELAGHRPTNSDRPHQWILQKLRTANPGPIKGKLDVLSGKLAAMQAERTKADYKLADSSPFTPTTGARMAQKAELWIRDFDALPLPELKKAIRPF